MRISTTPSPSFLRRGALMIISRGALMFIRRGAQMIIRRGVQMIITLLLCFVSTSMKADTIRPWTFWYWMYGAVSKEGIKADLQAMKDVGLGGCYLMPIRGVTEKPTYQGEVQQLTPKFWEMVDYAMQQSDSLGLEMGIHICDGFALAGGPWISPEESMQKVVWSDTIITVTSKNQNIPISQPAKGNQDYYEDIATYAIRAYNPLPKPHESGTIVRNENGDFRSKEAGYRGTGDQIQGGHRRGHYPGLSGDHLADLELYQAGTVPEGEESLPGAVPDCTAAVPAGRGVLLPGGVHAGGGFLPDRR